MSPDELHEHRITTLERQGLIRDEEIRNLSELAAARDERIANLAKENGELRIEVRDARAGVRTLIVILVGFAFTVAGSAVALALTLGGPS